MIHDQTREAGVDGRGGLKPSFPTALRLEWSSSSSRKLEKWEKTSKKSVEWKHLPHISIKETKIFSDRAIAKTKILKQKEF